MLRHLSAVWCVLFVALAGVAQGEMWDIEPFPPQISAERTTVCGPVSGVWTLAGSPYVVSCDVQVASGQTLTIEPGVEIQFTGAFDFMVYGTLRALGTVEDSILFTCTQESAANRWHGIRFWYASSQCLMEYCIVEKGRSSGSAYDAEGGGILALACSPTLRHCEIRHCVSINTSGGFHCDAGSPRLEDCYIHHNEALWRAGGIGIWHASPTIERCVIVNNISPIGGGIGLGQSQPVIRECTISYNTATTRGGGVELWYSENTTLSFIDNIVSHNTGSGFCFYTPGTALQLRYNDFYGNTGGNFQYLGNAPAGIGTITQTNANGDPCDAYQNIYLDPQFMNAAAGDYRLNCLSPCVNAGSSTQPHDGDGSVADIGALGPAGAAVNVLQPNGGGTWTAYTVDTVRWEQCGSLATVSLELNRTYPTGVWEPLKLETANDGVEAVFVLGPPSTTCRVRVRSVADEVVDASDADFTILAVTPETSDMGDIAMCGYPSLPFNPGHGLSGVAWLGYNVSGEATPHAIGSDPGDNGMSYAMVPWTPCENQEVIARVTGGPNFALFAAAGGILYLNGWKDGNLDGDFDDELCEGAASEWLVHDAIVTPGNHTFTVLDPGVTYLGAYDAIFRWRLSSQPLGRYGYGAVDASCPGMNYGGTAYDPVGEVEDYVFDEGQLAVELASFSVSSADGQIVVAWRTASETDNDHFEIQRDAMTVAQVATQGNDASGHRYSWPDPDVVAGRRYRYTLISVDVNGVREELGTRDVMASSGPATLTEYALHPNFPNPFNPSTTIAFDLVEAGDVTLQVFNVMGQKVAELAHGPYGAGQHSVTFDATNLPSGLYICRLQTGAFVAEQKLLLMK